MKDAIKNNMYKLFLKKPCAYNESKYKAHRNKLNHILKKAEKQHYTDLLTANKKQYNKNLANCEKCSEQK